MLDECRNHVARLEYGYGTDVTTKFRISMMFIFFNNLLKIMMIFKEALFDAFDSMLLSSLKKTNRQFFTFCFVG